MGSYLDKPETTKKSTLEENENISVASSSMQGWRINQEDAHNAILDFGNNTAFFAVYDGHGGSEVAEYCSLKLPDFLKDLQSYKNGNYEQALLDAFLGFDATLLEEKVVEELKLLARKNPDYDEESEAEEDDNEEVFNLHVEATMPLQEVLEKYKGNIAVQKLMQILPKKKEQDENSAGPSGSGSGCGSGSLSNKPPKSLMESEDEVSSSNSKTLEQTDAPSSSSSSNQQAAPDSTHTIPNSLPAEEIQSNSMENEVKPSPDFSPADRKKNESDNAISSSSSAQNDTGEKNVEFPSSSSSSSSTAAASASPINKTKVQEQKRVECEGGSGGSSSVNSSDSSSSPSSLKRKSASAVAMAGTDSDSFSDDENDTTYKEPLKSPKPVNSDGDTTDEEVDELSDVDDEEDLDEELSEEEEDDCLNNEFMDNMESGPGKASGCTAVVALMVGREVIVANAGDSRCIICRNGKAVEMSFDHKPEDDIEFERIKRAGGRVTLDGRVNGGLNLSRAIGDHGYKMNKELNAEQQMISAAPDLKKHTLLPGDEFMVLACDGIWNYMSNSDVVGFVKQRIDAGKLTLTEICEELFHNCLAPNTIGDGTGCDNMTAIIIKFKPTIFDLPTPQDAESNSEVQKTRKRSVDDENDSEALPSSEKKTKIDDDLTPSAVDTSTA